MVEVIATSIIVLTLDFLCLSSNSKHFLNPVCFKVLKDGLEVFVACPDYMIELCSNNIIVCTLCA